MKKRIAGLLMAVVLMMGMTGCDKLNPDQVRAIARTSGTMAAIGWISYDNPTASQKEAVVGTLDVVQSTIVGVGTNTYVAVVYPEAQKYVMASTKIANKDKPLVLAGSLAVLSGVDIMFASNPDWKKDIDNVNSYALAFISGANTALKTVVIEEDCEDCEDTDVPGVGEDCEDGDCSDELRSALIHYNLRKSIKE